MSTNDTSASPPRTRKTDDAVLPFPVRQRLWEELWRRLLAPPIEDGDRSVPPWNRQQEGR